jgi:hypothetical protein
LVCEKGGGGICTRINSETFFGNCIWRPLNIFEKDEFYNSFRIFLI